MTPSDISRLERQITAVLHHDAEIAMQSTDTESRYAELVASNRSSRSRQRLLWGIGLVAAATLVGALALGRVPGLFTNSQDTLRPTNGDRTPVQIASAFLNGLATYDATKASADVDSSDGQRLRIWPAGASLQHGLAWAEAASFKLSPRECVDEAPSGSATTVRCEFDWYFLGSDRLGGPPHRGEFSVEISGGQIQNVNTSMDWYVFGLRDDVHGDIPMWSHFASWLNREHPSDARVMIVKGGVVSEAFTRPAYTERSLELWARYVPEWVASQSR